MTIENPQSVKPYGSSIFHFLPDKIIFSEWLESFLIHTTADKKKPCLDKAKIYAV